MLLSEFWDQRILIIISGIIVYVIQPIGMIREKGKFSKRIINDSINDFVEKGKTFFLRTRFEMEPDFVKI